MNKAELLDKVSEKLPDVKSTVIAGVLNATLDTISEALEAKDDVKLINFGTFNIKHQAERQGRNIVTGESITISARDKVVFKPSTALSERVNK